MHINLKFFNIQLSEVIQFSSSCYIQNITHIQQEILALQPLIFAV